MTNLKLFTVIFVIVWTIGILGIFLLTSRVDITNNSLNRSRVIENLLNNY